MKLLLKEFKKDLRFITVKTKKSFSDFERALEKFADKIFDL